MTMSLTLQFLLAVAAVILLVFIVRRIKKSEMQIDDSVFWFFFAVSFVLLAVFPQIAYFFAEALGFDSAANFIFVYVVGVLIVREFSLTTKVASLRRKQKELVQQLALMKTEQDDAQNEK